MSRRPALFALGLAGVAAVAIAAAGCDRLLYSSPGEALFEKNCAKCHGSDGSGNTPGYMGKTYADLTDGLWKNGDDDVALSNAIAKGVFGEMPPFPQLSQKEVGELVAYVHQLGKKAHGSS